MRRAASFKRSGHYIAPADGRPRGAQAQAAPRPEPPSRRLVAQLETTGGPRLPDRAVRRMSRTSPPSPISSRPRTPPARLPHAAPVSSARLAGRCVRRREVDSTRLAPRAGERRLFSHAPAPRGRRRVRRASADRRSASSGTARAALGVSAERSSWLAALALGPTAAATTSRGRLLFLVCSSPFPPFRSRPMRLSLGSLRLGRGRSSTPGKTSA
jgi:hypothetical protein